MNTYEVEETTRGGGRLIVIMAICGFLTLCSCCLLAALLL